MSYGGRGPPPDVEGMISLKVDNLTYRTTPDDLRRAFSKYGDIGDIYIPRDRFTRDSRGFAFIRFYDRRDAEDAIDSMDGRVMDGRELRVQMARYGRPDDRDRYRDRRPPRRSPRRRHSRSRSRSKSRSRSPDRRRRHSRSNSRSPRRERTPGSSRSRSPTPKSKSKSPTPT